MRRFVPGLLLTAAFTVWSGCGNSSSTPTGPTPVGVPSLVCPASISIVGVTVPSLIETYPAPIESGGAPPVNVSCQPVSGSAFPIGNTTVTCTATDARNQPATCAFHVTITSQQLAAMTFVAFGDSITAGENGLNPTNASEPTQANFTGCTPASAANRRVASLNQAKPNWIDVPNSYPTMLQTMLDGRFIGEGITVINEGSPGEVTSSAMQGCTGVLRLPVVLAADQPNVLLILEGINDLSGMNPPMETNQVMTDLGTMVTDARNAQPAPKYIFLSTLLPVLNNDVGCAPNSQTEPPCRNFAEENEEIQAANALIAVLAQSRGVPLVDAYTAFYNQDPSFVTLIGPDGLHPTPLGNQVLAQTFYNAVVGTVPITSRFGRR
jgi:lysophospholipase L1-like esterase